MIGNDIVDLELARTESNWKRPGFMQKIFTVKELRSIARSQDKELAVWELWSRKEAAYKIYNRLTKERSFIPHLLECSEAEAVDGFFCGKVAIGCYIFNTKTKITPDYIYTIAATDVTQLNSLSHSFEKYKKDEFGLPYIEGEKNTQKRIVSITHHGRFCRHIAMKIARL